MNNTKFDTKNAAGDTAKQNSPFGIIATFIVLAVALMIGVVAIGATPDYTKNGDINTTVGVNEDVNRENTGTGGGGGGIKYRFQ